MSMRNELAVIADPAYREFQAKLVPTVEPESILGVRTPELRRFARTLWKDRPAEARAFLNEPLPHETYDEMNLHGLLIGMAAQTPSEAIDLLDRFLPHVDNWATSDLIRVPAFKRDLPATLVQLRAWMQATGPHTEYVVRFGVTQLMELFLGDDFAPEQLTWVAAIERPEYYINMARAGTSRTPSSSSPRPRSPSSNKEAPKASRCSILGRIINRCRRRASRVA